MNKLDQKPLINLIDELIAFLEDQKEELLEIDLDKIARKPWLQDFFHVHGFIHDFKNMVCVIVHTHDMLLTRLTKNNEEIWKKKYEKN